MLNNTCITAVLLYQYRHFDGRRGKNEKYVVVTTHRTLTLTLIGTPWVDQYVDAGACEGSWLILPTWLICSERLC